MAGIWAQVLKIGRVGVYDNFFDLEDTRCWLPTLSPRLRDAAA
jgi:hypothetical protein